MTRPYNADDLTFTLTLEMAGPTVCRVVVKDADGDRYHCGPDMEHNLAMSLQGLADDYRRMRAIGLQCCPSIVP